MEKIPFTYIQKSVTVRHHLNIFPLRFRAYSLYSYKYEWFERKLKRRALVNKNTCFEGCLHFHSRKTPRVQSNAWYRVDLNLDSNCRETRSKSCPLYRGISEGRIILPLGVLARVVPRDPRDAEQSNREHFYSWIPINSIMAVNSAGIERERAIKRAVFSKIL